MYLDLSIPATVFRVPSLPDTYQCFTTITIITTSSLTNFYNEYQTFILKIIQFIIDKVTLTTAIEEIQLLQAPLLQSEFTYILTNLRAIKAAMIAEVHITEGIINIHSIIMLIVENIIKGTSMTFLIPQIKNLQSLITQEFDC
jgi:hypothetical protein